MNKAFAWISIVISLLAGVFAVIVLIGLPLIPKDDLTGIGLPQWKIAVLLLIIIAYVALVFVSNFRKVRKPEKLVAISYSGILDIRISGTMDFKSYRKLMLVLIFKKSVMLRFPLILVGVVVFNLQGFNSADILSSLLTLLILIAVIGFIVLRLSATWKQKFNDNKLLSAPLKYHLTNENLHAETAETISTLKWTLFVKSKETEDFILLYQSENVANFFLKQWFPENDLNEFRRFLLSLSIKRE